MAYAYCYQSGHIDIAKHLADVPIGTIIFAKGAQKKVEEAVSARARHAYDGETLLVPGVPEAESAEAAYKAFIGWHSWAFPDQTYRRWG